MSPATGTKRPYERSASEFFELKIDRPVGPPDRRDTVPKRTVLAVTLYWYGALNTQQKQILIGLLQQIHCRCRPHGAYLLKLNLNVGLTE